MDSTVELNYTPQRKLPLELTHENTTGLSDGYDKPSLGGACPQPRRIPRVHKDYYLPTWVYEEGAATRSLHQQGEKEVDDRCWNPTKTDFAV